MGHYFENYCKDYENIENYQKALADNFKGWQCHHRLETHTSDGERRLIDITVAELKALVMYYNRPAEELIFLPTSEHRLLHNEGENSPNYGKPSWNKGKKMSEETKNKMSEAKKGKRTQTMANIFQKKLKRKCLKQGNGKIFGQKEHIGLIMAK